MTYVREEKASKPVDESGDAKFVLGDILYRHGSAYYLLLDHVFPLLNTCNHPSPSAYITSLPLILSV